MIPVVTPEEMAAIDAAAPEPVEVLIDRAGAAVARVALQLLGGAYGRRVVVLAGKGNNGADGRAAADRLRRRGLRVEVIEALDAPASLPACDLVIDAAYGAGFRGAYEAPDPGEAAVLAVDIPSGVSGLTGEAAGHVLEADATVTFAAVKPGLLLEPGRSLAGWVLVADIGLDTSAARAWVVERDDVAAWIPSRPVDSHKWQAAVLVVAGSAGMTGAARLCAAAAQRAGAGMVKVATPGAVDEQGSPLEAVGLTVPGEGWAGDVLDALPRFGSLVMGPGLGTAVSTMAAIRQVTSEADVPVVVDGDALTALGNEAPEILASRTEPTVLTPHDGEYERLTGSPPDADRFSAARSLAEATGATVLLKGPTTIVAEPAGEVRVVTVGDERLATAGTGDVLSGIIGALLAQEMEPLEAAAAGAWLHGRAGVEGPPAGLVASDLLDLLPIALSEVTA